MISYSEHHNLFNLLTKREKKTTRKKKEKKNEKKRKKKKNHHKTKIRLGSAARIVGSLESQDSIATNIKIRVIRTTSRICSQN
jgi:hypothetical protein